MRTEFPQFYDHRTEQLAHSQQEKVRKLVERVEQTSEATFACRPIPGYNKRTYTIRRSGEIFSCNCQHYVTKGTPCSHIGAVWEWLQINKQDRQGNTLLF
jgi:hypothetical protein